MWTWWRGRLRARPAVAAALVIGLSAASVGAYVLGRRVADIGSRTGDAHGSTRPLTAADRPSPANSSPVPAATPAPAGPATSLAGPPNHFATLTAGSRLPSTAQCTAWVRAMSFPENKAVNSQYNQTIGHRLGPSFFPVSDDSRANTLIAVRVDGEFTGTTRQILRWAACKWGIDEDIVYAQAAKESWWRQPAKGDWGSDPGQCAPGHGLGADGRAGQCPQSFGILQNRYAIEQSSWPGIAASTAMNADTAYAIWRACLEGYERWLNTVDRGGPYSAGDAWGCVGRWFAGRWHTGPADQYIAGVQDYLRQRVWEQRDFQEP